MKIQSLSELFLLSLLVGAVLLSCDNSEEMNKQMAIAEARAREDSLQLSQGKQIFYAQCAICHQTRLDNPFAGTADLSNTVYLKLYITKQDSLINAKDKRALELKNIFGHQGNSHNFSFSDAELYAVISFLRKYWR